MKKESSEIRYLTASHEIEVSAYLITWFDTEDQIAFVLAHEWTHYYRKQHPLLPNGDSALGLYVAENEADEYGLRIGAKAGYNPFATISALRKYEELDVYQNLLLDDNEKVKRLQEDGQHLPLPKRLARLEQLIREYKLDIYQDFTPISAKLKSEVKKSLIGVD